MKNRLFIVCLGIIFLMSAAAKGNPAAKSTHEQQTDIVITVYNNNFALIKDTRNVRLFTGKGEVRFMDIASSIIPETVHIQSLNHPANLAVLEQNYKYDLISPDKLLDKYVGKKIKIIDWNKFHDRKEEVDAVLINNNRGPIYKINGDFYLGHPGYKVLPDIPDNFVTTPTLTWKYNNEENEDHHIEVYYLTRNISWNADYVVVIDATNSHADISGWVTLDNKSGAIYNNASIRLVAGSVNTSVNAPVMARHAMNAMAMAEQGDAQFNEKGFSDYHVYDLFRKSTLKDKEAKQISFFEASKVSVKDEYIVEGRNSYFTGQYIGHDKKQPVSIYINFDNSKKNNLGMPIPAGIMRVYKNDKSNLLFVGEDRIGHTPKDEEIRLNIGSAFDVVAEKIQTDYERISTKLHESEWEVTLRNHKEKDIVVSIIETPYGNWKIIKNSHPFKKVDASTIRFDVEVPHNEEVTVKYRIKVGL